MSVPGEGRSSKGTTQGKEEEEPEDSQNVPFSKLRAMKRVGDGKRETGRSGNWGVKRRGGSQGVRGSLLCQMIQIGEGKEGLMRTVLSHWSFGSVAGAQPANVLPRCLYTSRLALSPDHIGVSYSR